MKKPSLDGLKKTAHGLFGKTAALCPVVVHKKAKADACCKTEKKDCCKKPGC